MQSKLEFFLWKILGALFLMTILTFVLQDKGFIPNALPPILIAGISNSSLTCSD